MEPVMGISIRISVNYQFLFRVSSRCCLASIKDARCPSLRKWYTNSHHTLIIMSEMSDPGSHSPAQEMDLPILDASDDDGSADFLPFSDAEVLSSPTLAKLRKAIDSIAQRLKDNPSYSNQFLIISDLPPGLLEKLEGRKPDAVFRVSIYQGLKKAIIRVMPSRTYDQIATMFSMAVAVRLDRMGLEVDDGHWAGIGSSRFQGQTCAKEADMGIIPGPNLGRQADNVWPSIVAEIGVSESLSHLRTDAQWWWSNSGHKTAVIVLFAVCRLPSPSVSIETWTAQHVPVQGRETRQRSESATIRPQPLGSHPTALVLRRDQNITMTSTTVTTPPLRIPFQSVMRRLPVGTETDIVIDTKALKNICRAVL